MDSCESVSQNPAYKWSKHFDIPSLFGKRILGRPGSDPGEGSGDIEEPAFSHSVPSLVLELKYKKFRFKT